MKQSSVFLKQMNVFFRCCKDTILGYVTEEGSSGLLGSLKCTRN